MDKRFITGLIVGFTAFFAILAGGKLLASLVLIGVICLVREYNEILKHKGFLPSFKIIIISSIVFAAIAYFNRLDLLPLAFTLTALLALLSVLFKGKQPYIANVATTIFGCLYCGWFPLYLLFLRGITPEMSNTGLYADGLGYAMILLFSVLVCDTFCYFVGCKFGKHKLSPVISPNKTIEGAIGGAAMCVIFSLGIGIPIGLPWYHALILGILIAVFAQLGDLCESMIKRDAGVKDSSNILPGHGGFLDRLDSYLLTIPVVYYYIQYFILTNIFADIFKGWF